MSDKGIDWKFIFSGKNPCTGKEVSQHNAIIFKASDALLPEILEHYMELLRRAEAQPEQIEGVRLLRLRVLYWQERNAGLCKLPDLNQCEVDLGISGHPKQCPDYLENRPKGEQCQYNNGHSMCPFHGDLAECGERE